MTHFIGELSGFQILASQQHIGIFQPSAFKTETDGHANQMRRLDCQKRVIRGIGSRDSGRCRKRIDLIAGFILINGDQCLDEVIFRQALTARVDPDKNICDIFLICVIADLQSRQRIIGQIQ